MNKNDCVLYANIVKISLMNSVCRYAIDTYE